MRRRTLSIVVAAIAAALVAVLLLSREPPAETRFTGAYVFDDGSLAFIVPSEREVLRFRTLHGESALLWPVGESRYEGGGPWARRQPVLNRFEFQMEGRRPAGLLWRRGEEAARTAHRMRFVEDTVFFRSGELKLRGKLVAPQGAGPYPAVVLVHGSEDYSAVDHYFEPYLYAAHGIAAFVFDKRGTGESWGKYVQNFEVLADDVVAAVEWVRLQQQVDPTRIHLAGFSQGGWVAPLAARKDGGVRSLLIGHGVLVSVVEEDRWAYVYALRKKGFREEAIAQVDRINEVLYDTLTRNADRWSEVGAMLREARSEPWYETMRASESALGFVASKDLPVWMIRAYARWRIGRHRDPAFIDFLHDPVPTMADLNIPSLWILGGEDSSAPTDWTVARLKSLQQAGKPVEYFVYPHAEHGILRFDETDGARNPLGYEADYFSQQVRWLKQQNELPLLTNE